MTKTALVKRQYSFSQRVINEMNKVSSECVDASSVNMFKNKGGLYIYDEIVGLSISPAVATERNAFKYTGNSILTLSSSVH